MKLSSLGVVPEHLITSVESDLGCEWDQQISPEKELELNCITHALTIQSFNFNAYLKVISLYVAGVEFLLLDARNGP